jgi:MFS superfamily sulfate permease-like transporter
LYIAALVCLSQFDAALGLQMLHTQNYTVLQRFVESCSSLSNVATFVPALVFIVNFCFYLKVDSYYDRFYPVMLSCWVICIFAGLATMLGSPLFNMITVEQYLVYNTFETMMPNPGFWSLQTIGLAAVIAVVSILESVGLASACDRVTKSHHNSRQEVSSLGMANILSGGKLVSSDAVMWFNVLLCVR